LKIEEFKRCVHLLLREEIEKVSFFAKREGRRSIERRKGRSNAPKNYYEHVRSFGFVSPHPYTLLLFMIAGFW